MGDRSPAGHRGPSAISREPRDARWPLVCTPRGRTALLNATRRQRDERDQLVYGLASCTGVSHRPRHPPDCSRTPHAHTRRTAPRPGRCRRPRGRSRCSTARRWRRCIGRRRGRSGFRCRAWACLRQSGLAGRGMGQAHRACVPGIGAGRGTRQAGFTGCGIRGESRDQEPHSRHHGNRPPYSQAEGRSRGLVWSDRVLHASRAASMLGFRRALLSTQQLLCHTLSTANSSSFIALLAATCRTLA